MLRSKYRSVVITVICCVFSRYTSSMNKDYYYYYYYYYYRCNTFIRKGCNRFKILLRFQIFCIKSNENMVWACHLPQRWECHTIFGRKFLEIYVVRRQNTPLKFVSTRFRVRLYFVNEKIKKNF